MRVNLIMYFHLKENYLSRLLSIAACRLHEFFYERFLLKFSGSIPCPSTYNQTSVFEKSVRSLRKEHQSLLD